MYKSEVERGIETQLTGRLLQWLLLDLHKFSRGERRLTLDAQVAVLSLSCVSVFTSESNRVYDKVSHLIEDGLGGLSGLRLPPKSCNAKLLKRMQRRWVCDSDRSRRLCDQRSVCLDGNRSTRMNFLFQVLRIALLGDRLL